MVIVDTFEVVEDALFSVQFDHEEQNALERIFELWNDTTYLHDFFSEHIDDLTSGFFGDITIKDAVRRTYKEAQQLEEELLRLAETGDTNNNLSHLFKPLTHDESGKTFEKDKAYGLNHKSWLRLYAIRVNVNVFVICGGAIKLTETMNDRTHLLHELEKLDITKEYVESSDQFFELSL